MFSRASMNEVTRVMSAWNASTCRSNISSAYSRKVSGTPHRALRDREVRVGRFGSRDALLHVPDRV